MEGTNKTQLRVGVFLAIGLLAALVSILALGRDRSIFRSYLHLNAKLEQVQGLSAGSVVSLSGMTVGNIDEIDFAKEGDQQLVVMMKIDGKYRNRIPKDSTVEVRTQGALGDKFIYITPGNPNSGLVEDHDALEPMKSQDLIGMLTEKGGQAAKFFDAVQELQILLHTINSGDKLNTIMKNSAEATGDLKAMAKEAKAMIGELRSQNSGTLASSMRRLDSILTKIDKGEGSLGALINDPSIHNQLKSVLGASPRKQYYDSILKNSIEKKGP